MLSKNVLEPGLEAFETASLAKREAGDLMAALRCRADILPLLLISS